VNIHQVSRRVTNIKNRNRDLRMCISAYGLTKPVKVQKQGQEEISMIWSSEVGSPFNERKNYCVGSSVPVR
jgi:hypothetical protein